ncbi:MAG: IS30 family transposase [Bacteroidales bacterium]|nr:IS30 family transposase [Bacteroidales bacterium]
MKQRPHYIKFTDEMKRTVRRLIVYGQYSPEQIAGRCKLRGEEMVSKETIYKWIWKEKRRGNGSDYSSRGQIKDRVDISLRPPEVDQMLRFGDFEIDTIIGKNRKGAVMTINDRCTQIVLIRKLTGKEAGPLAEKAIDALAPYKDMIHTITADNGKEFARHKEIAGRLGIQFYFATPYHSWERGANENTNGLARQYIPKGSDFDLYSEDYIAEVEWKLNHRPRKSLGYLTPLEYFKKLYNFDFGSRCTSI